MRTIEVMLFESKENPGKFMPSEAMEEVNLEQAEWAMMSANENGERPDAKNLYSMLNFWLSHEKMMKEKFGEEYIRTFHFREVFDYYNPVVKEIPYEKYQEAMEE